MHKQAIALPTRGLHHAVLALTAVSLASISCTGSRDLGPSAMGRSQQELSNPLFAVTGVYADGWIGPTGSLQLAEPADKTALRVRALVPLTNDPAFRTTLEVRVDNEPVARRTVGLGTLDFSFPVLQGAGKRRIDLAFDRTQALPGGDGRQVGARLEWIGFERPGPAMARAAADIVASSQVHLGAGWGSAETLGSEVFRSVENDAQIEFRMKSARDAILTMRLEPNPGAGNRPVLLRVLDASGHQASAILLDRRRIFRLPLPLSGTGEDVFKLHAEASGEPLPTGRRPMNFRVFAIEAEPWHQGR